MVVLALVGAGCGAGGDDDAAPVVEVTTEGITGTVEIRSTNVDHPASGDDVEPIGEVLDISTDGTVEAGATVTIDASEPIGVDEIVVVATAESEDGPWVPLPVVVSGGKVTATIEHLSLFSFLRFPDPTDIVEEVWNDVTSDLFAAATPPSCDDEEGARGDGYEVASEGPDVLLWCLGRDGQGRYLRVVNNRRYPVILSSSLLVREVDDARSIGNRLAEALAEDQVVLPPRAQVTYAADVETGGGPLVRAEFDGLAYSLYQLQFGVELAGAFLTRFGTQAAAPRTIEALLANAGCVDALVAGAPGRILTSCLDSDGLSALFGGLGAAIATPIMLTAGVLSFLQTAASSFWDEVSRRDNYEIAFVRPEAAECALENFESLDSRLSEHSEWTVAYCKGGWALVRSSDGAVDAFRKEGSTWRSGLTGEYLCGGPRGAPPEVVGPFCSGDPQLGTSDPDPTGPVQCRTYTAYADQPWSERWAVAVVGVACEEASRILGLYENADKQGSSGHAMVDGWACYTDVAFEGNAEVFAGGCDKEAAEILLSSAD